MGPVLARRFAAGLVVFAIGGLTACENMNPAGPSSQPGQISGRSGMPAGVARTVTGEVRQVDGPPLADVRIGTSIGGNYYPLAKTASDGSFRLEQFAGDSIVFDRPGYASVLWTVPAGAGPKDTLALAIRIQPWLFVSAATPLTANLTDDDARFESGDSLFEMGDYDCHPCKMAILSDSSRDPVTLRVTWTGDLSLSLWVGDGYSPPSVFRSRTGANEITAVFKDNTYVSQVLVGVDPRNGAVPANATAAFTLTVER